MGKGRVQAGRSPQTRSMSRGNASRGESPTPSIPKKSTKKIEMRDRPNKKRGTSGYKEKRYFTVAEDWVLIQYYTKHSDSKSEWKICEELAQKVPHPTDSIRDRLRKVLLRLRRVDLRLIEDNASVPIV